MGPLFRNQTLNGDRNELIISITPHLVRPGGVNVYPGPPLPSVPTAAPLPTLAPGAVLPEYEPTAGPGPTVAAKNASSSPAATASPATPAPHPQQTSNANPLTYRYGSIPANNTTTSSDPPVIYYVTLSPTLVSYGTPVDFAAITSTNILSLTLSNGGISISLSQSGAGSWHGAFPFTCELERY